MIDEALLAELHHLATTLAPELKIAPLYLFPPDIAKPWYPGFYASGVANKRGSVLARKHLEDSGTWAGPGPMISILDDTLSRTEVLHVMVHELAHIVPCEPCLDIPPTAENISETVEAIAAFAPTQGIPPDYPRWIGGHDANYIRSLTHLWWRAALHAGHVLLMRDLFDGFRYDLCPLEWFHVALGAEPIRMQHATFAEILATDPPRDFTGLWMAGVLDWQKLHPERTLEIMEKSA